MAVRKQQSIPITGIDLSSADGSVKDGKCLVLNNLRYNGGAWRPMHKLQAKFQGVKFDNYEEQGVRYYAYAVATTPFYFKNVKPSQGDDVYSIRNGAAQTIGIVEDVVDVTEYDVILDNEKGEIFHATPSRDRVLHPVYQKASEDAEWDEHDVTTLWSPMDTIQEKMVLFGMNNGRLDVLYYVDDAYYVEQEDTWYARVLNKNGLVIGTIYINNTLEYSPKSTFYSFNAYYSTDATPQVNTILFRNINDNWYSYVISEITDTHPAIELIYELQDGQMIKVDYPLERREDLDVDWERIAFNYQILYHHPVCADNRYIAKAINDDRGADNLVLVQINEDKNIELIQVLRTLEDGEDISVTHFGKVLIVSNNTKKEMYYYRLVENETYQYVDFNAMTLNANFYADQESRTYNPESLVIKGSYSDGWYVGEKVCSKNLKEWFWQDFDEGKDTLRGKFGVFAALRDEAGNVITKTEIAIISTYHQKRDVGENVFYYDKPSLDYLDGQKMIDSNPDTDPLAEDRGYFVGAFVKGLPTYPTKESILEDKNGLFIGLTGWQIYGKAQVQITIPDNLDAIVKDVAIYSTRLVSFANKVADKPEDIFKNDTEILLEPFFRMDVIPVGEFNDRNQYNYTIGYSKLKNIVTNEAYVSTQLASQLYGKITKEYQNRFHLADMVVKKPSLYIDDSVKSSTNYSDTILVSFDKDGQEKYFIYKASEFGCAGFDGGAGYGEIRIPYLADKVILAKETADDCYKINTELVLTQNVSMPLSFVGKQYHYTSRSGITLINVADSVTISASNRIQASEANDCFVYPYENSYRIGMRSSHIIAINSAAIEMSDNKFGEFRLFAFTDEGVYALQSGGASALYSSIIPINYDVAINPNTLAVKNHLVYITERGLKLIYHTATTLISQEINTKDFLQQEIMKDVYLYYLPEYDEMMLYHPAHHRIFVYSFEDKIWYTRSNWDSFDCRPIGNNEIITHDSIYLLNKEDETKLEANSDIATRKMYLGSNELKRLESVLARFESESLNKVTIQISGGIHPNKPLLLRNEERITQEDIRIVRVPLSAKYVQFSIAFDNQDEFRFKGIDLEYYFKYINKMK